MKHIGKRQKTAQNRIDSDNCRMKRQSLQIVRICTSFALKYTWSSMNRYCFQLAFYIYFAISYLSHFTIKPCKSWEPLVWFQWISMNFTSMVSRIQPQVSVKMSIFKPRLHFPRNEMKYWKNYTIFSPMNFFLFGIFFWEV